MSLPTTLFGSISPDDFLRDYWQKKPLLIRNAIPGFTSPLEPEELAGLACEEDVTARLILEHGGAYPWEMRYGPFDPDDFAALPETHWTLLVQEVDRLVPDVADVLDAFRFLPNWRLDDVQISFAPQGGNAGAHIDNYDVFLLQGRGHRRWQISTEPIGHAAETYVPDLDVRLLENFEADEEWVLGPGDMIYLPPRVPHYGVALDDCMTYSIGLRAPSHADIATAFFAHAADLVDPAARYADPGLQRPENPGHITAEALTRIRAVLHDLVDDTEAVNDWFGRYITEPRRMPLFALEDPFTPDELLDALYDEARLRCSAVADFAYTADDDTRPILYAGGHAFRLDPDLAFAAPLLTGPEVLTADTLADHLENAAFLTLLTNLVNEGCLVVE